MTFPEQYVDSSDNVKSVHPEFYDDLIDYIDAVNDAAPEGWQVALRQGARNIQEQIHHMGHGRTPAPFSLHNMGLAADLSFQKDGTPVNSKHPDFSEISSVMGPIAKEMNLTWGGNWNNAEPWHIQKFASHVKALGQYPGLKDWYNIFKPWGIGKQRYSGLFEQITRYTG